MATTSEEMKVIIKASPLSKIPYSENPPAEGGEIRYLTLAEFQEKFNCEYTEGVVVKASQWQPITESDFKDRRAKAAHDRLLHPLESLVISKMSNDTGHGLFTTQDIKMGTVICVYGGEYDPETTEFVYSYGGVNSARIGGVARFMQHQPISKENHKAYLTHGLQDYRLFAIQENITEEQAKNLLSKPEFVSEKTKEYNNKIKDNDFYMGYDFKLIDFIDKQLPSKIAQSNVSIETTKVAGVDLILMVAMRDIKKNESIGFSYGVMYWQHPTIKNTPLLFTKEGKVIPEKNRYKYKQNRVLEEAFGLFDIHHSSDSSSDESSDDECLVDIALKNTGTLETLIKTLSQSKSNLEKESKTTSTVTPTKNIDKVEVKLQDKTLSFFNKSLNTQWKKYPEDRLTDKYKGHQVLFFTMSVNEVEQTKKFFQVLKKTGFDVELKKAKNKPSIVVDLTTSKLAIQHEFQPRSKR